ncbi:hypothetical protein C6P40_004977, partial [Pichia californica]
MSTPQHHTQQPTVPATTVQVTPESLQEAGISRLDNGNYVLPPVLVQYRGGNTQTLVIEVGDPIHQTNSLSSASLMTVAQLLRSTQPGATPIIPSNTVSANTQPATGDSSVNNDNTNNNNTNNNNTTTNNNNNNNNN